MNFLGASVSLLEGTSLKQVTNAALSSEEEATSTLIFIATCLWSSLPRTPVPRLHNGSLEQTYRRKILSLGLNLCVTSSFFVQHCLRHCT